MRLRRLAFPVAALITAGAATSVAHAATATTVQSGWWTTVEVGQLAVPTATPSNQLQVSNGFKGPLAFAAVRITPPSGTPGTDQAALKMTIPSGSSVGTPTVSACVTTSSWKPGADQPAAAAPGYTCDHGFSVKATVGNSTATWTVPLSWAAHGSISLALVPTPGTTTPFSVAYDQPTPSSVSFTAPAPPAPSSGTGAGTVAPDTQPVEVTPSPSGDVSSFPANSGTPDVSGSAVSAPAAAPSLGDLSSGQPSTSANASTGSPAPVAAPASAAPGGGADIVSTPSRVPRLVAFILLIFVGVALFGLAGQPDRAPRLLGPLGTRMLEGRRPALAAGGPGGAGGVEPVPATAGAAPMGGGARIRAHRQARLARARGEQPAPASPGGAQSAAGAYGEILVVAPVRGIGRFARPRHGPPRRI